MKKIIVLLALISSAYVCCAQVADDFSDDDYTNNPTWTPDITSNWTVVSQQLRSNSATASSSFYITTPSAKATNAQWEFFVQLQFNTSSANLVDVYLISEKSNLLEAGNNGYFVRIGGTPDEISLYKIVNGTASIIINGTDGVTNRSNNPLRIKVTRDANDLWTLERDASGGTNYVTEGTVTDNSINTSNYFGIRILQSTATFFNRHFFDDIYAGDIVTEKIPPVLQTTQVISNTQLLLTFSEALDKASAEDELNYFVTNGGGNPQLAELQGDGNDNAVRLTFQNTFANGVTNTIEVKGLKDLVDNEIVPVSNSFLFFQASPVSAKDIIITELMADPSPQIGLPDAEFLEVYNRSANPIDVAGWKFSDGTATTTLPSQIILPGQYWILCSTTNTAGFSGFGNALGVSNFPTLNNAGEPLVLRDASDATIDSVNYNTEWYKDEDKKEGGWSLERIDLNNLCAEEENWVASEDAKGGTPGKVNSVNANKPDLTGPQLLTASAISANELLLQFNEKLEKDLSQVSFVISPTILVSKVEFTNSALREIRLTLSENFSTRQLYTVEVKNLRDCNGNFINEEKDHLTFALPENAEAGDVLINEILFNPKPNGVDFVEVYNVSDKYLNLKNWSLANVQDENIVNAKIITQSDFILAPNTYLVFASSKSILISYHLNAVESSVFEMTIPSMNDDSGSIALVANDAVVLDFFNYDEGYHSKLLKDKEGVSLERISVMDITNNPSNWKSANSAAGFATPGFINSNTRPENAADENSVVIEPEIFSPEVPGQDFTQINYRFDQNGFVANVKIADHQGRIIKEIANNETLGFEGFFRWDGDRTDGSKARMGYYFVWFEVFDITGTLKTFRKRVVIGK